VIEAPVEKVFGFVTDFDNHVKTQPLSSFNYAAHLS